MEKVINIFGDSIVRGACDSEMGGWVNRLQIYLSSKNDDYFEVYNLGIGGNNSEGLLTRFSNENASRNPNTILVAIGINDSQYINSKDNPRVPLQKFEQNLMELIKQAKKFTEEIIFVGLTKVDETRLMPVPWDETKYYDEESVALYNSKIKEICSKNDLMFIEMLDLLSDDDLEEGLHPNSKGHKKIFLRVKDFLEENKIV